VNHDSRETLLTDTRNRFSHEANHRKTKRWRKLSWTS